MNWRRSDAVSSYQNDRTASTCAAQYTVELGKASDVSPQAWTQQAFSLGQIEFVYVGLVVFRLPTNLPGALTVSGSIARTFRGDGRSEEEEEEG
jgi:hypothetical protein